MRKRNNIDGNLENLENYMSSVSNSKYLQREEEQISLLV